MAPRRVKKENKLDYNNLSANDVICPICRSILIEPITLPCSHGFCLSCFKAASDANVVCPLCRVRVGSWLRTATKSNKLVNEAFWQRIQVQFPSQIKKKLGKTGQNHEVSGDCKSGQSKDDNEKRSQAKSENCIDCDAKSKPELEETDEKREMLLKKFATKEYTCRILCQNMEAHKNMIKESHTIQKRNRRIQEVTLSETSRSNSIDSECLYFKPIDHRRNPPSEGLTPIKVPTRKPNVSQNIKILAPSGQNRINLNHLESAFARLCSPAMQPVETCKKENIETVEKEYGTVKRKQVKPEPQAKKKLRSFQSAKSKASVCDNEPKLAASEPELDLTNSHKEINILTDKERLKRALQEQADFELATKLQQTYNQSRQYSTRSRVCKEMAATNQVKMAGLMTSYKVK